MKRFKVTNFVNRNSISAFFMRDTRKKVILISIGVFVIILAAALVIILGSRVNYSAATAPIKDKGIISIGLRSDLEGFAKLNTKTNTIEGYEADIAREIVNKLFPKGINVQYKEINTKTGKVMLDDGELDMSFAAYVPMDTENYIAYTNSYYTDGNVFYVKKGGIGSISQLKDKKVGVVTSSYAGYKTNLEQYFANNNIKCTVMYYSSYPDAVDALNFGHIDALAGGSVLTKAYVNTKENTRISGYIMPYGYCIAVKKTNTQLQKAINQILADIKEDGTLTRLMQKWNLESFSKN